MAQAQHHAASSSNNRLNALKARHAALSRDIDDMMKHAAISDFDLRRKKVERLRIKEEIQGISETS